jgi:hypothetical protein
LAEPVNPRLHIPVKWDRFSDDLFQGQFWRLAADQDRFLDLGREEGELGSGPSYDSEWLVAAAMAFNDFPQRRSAVQICARANARSIVLSGS